MASIRSLPRATEPNTNLLLRLRPRHRGQRGWNLRQCASRSLLSVSDPEIGTALSKDFAFSRCLAMLGFSGLRKARSCAKQVFCKPRFSESGRGPSSAGSTLGKPPWRTQSAHRHFRRFDLLRAHKSRSNVLDGKKRLSGRSIVCQFLHSAGLSDLSAQHASRTRCRDTET